MDRVLKSRLERVPWSVVIGILVTGIIGWILLFIWLAGGG
jgi:hypothetical protein